MLPIGDFNPRRHMPVITILLVAANVLVFLYQVMLPEDALEMFILQAGMVPYQVTQGWDADAAASLFSSMFMHGSLMHIASNMLYLWIFGDNVEDCLGPVGFLFAYLAFGVIAGLSQVAVAPLSQVPTIGASGAVAGVLGAYLVLYPKAKVRTLLFIFYFVRVRDIPALMVLGYWFILQLFNGVATLGVQTGGGVAWFAHIGGFVAGLFAGWLCRSRRMPARAPDIRRL